MKTRRRRSLFLCDAFGFTRHAVYADQTDPSVILHAQLVLGNSMIMLGTARDDPQGAQYRWRLAREAGGVTVAFYIFTPDPDAHHARASAHDAEIIRAPHPNDGYPGRGYEARDPEGNVWSFGSYDPWAQN